MRGPRLVVVAALLAAAAACVDTDESDQNTGTPAAAGEPVVVYAAVDDKTYLPALFDAYTEDTGIVVIVRHAGPTRIVDDVIENEISPPADVLWTPSVAGVWRAADEGALRPLYSEHVADNVPSWLRDPDGFWFGVSYRTAVIVYDAAALDATAVSDYAALAGPEFNGRLCLSSPDNSVNQAVIAMLIDELGRRPAELVVRGWMTNLAMPVRDDEQDLIDAIHSGRCAVGIASSSAVAVAKSPDPPATVAVFTPATPIANAEGLGVARHARNAAGATALIEWLTTPAIQARHAARWHYFPANGDASHAGTPSAARNVSVVAWNRDEAVKLAERAGYR